MWTRFKSLAAEKQTENGKTNASEDIPTNFTISLDDGGTGAKAVIAPASPVAVAPPSAVPTDRKENGKGDEGVKAAAPQTVRKIKVGWTEKERRLFFEAVQQHGKDYQLIEQYINRRSGAVKARKHIRQYYHKAVRFLEHRVQMNTKDAPAADRVAAEVFLLINYGIYIKKLLCASPSVNIKKLLCAPSTLNMENKLRPDRKGGLDRKMAANLKQLINEGSVVPLNKRTSLRTPACPALGKIFGTNSDEPKIPDTVQVELEPKDSAAFNRVHGILQNPHVRFTMCTRDRLSSLIRLIQKKWATPEMKLKAQVLKDKGTHATASASSAGSTSVGPSAGGAVEAAPGVPVGSGTECDGPSLTLYPHKEATIRHYSVTGQQRNSNFSYKIYLKTVSKSGFSDDRLMTTVEEDREKAKLLPSATDTKEVDGNAVSNEEEKVKDEVISSEIDKEEKSSEDCKSDPSFSSPAAGSGDSGSSQSTEVVCTVTSVTHTDKAYLITSHSSPPVTLPAAITAAMATDNDLAPSKSKMDDSDTPAFFSRLLERHTNVSTDEKKAEKGEGGGECEDGNSEGEQEEEAREGRVERENRLREEEEARRKAEVLKKEGWTVKSAVAMTVAELYLLLDCPAKVCLSYGWGDSSDGPNGGELRNMLHRLSHLAVCEFSSFTKRPPPFISSPTTTNTLRSPVSRPRAGTGKGRTPTTSCRPATTSSPTTVVQLPAAAGSGVAQVMAQVMAGAETLTGNEVSRVAVGVGGNILLAGSAAVTGSVSEPVFRVPVAMPVRAIPRQSSGQVVNVPMHHARMRRGRGKRVPVAPTPVRSLAPAMTITSTPALPPPNTGVPPTGLPPNQKVLSTQVIDMQSFINKKSLAGVAAATDNSVAFTTAGFAAGGANTIVDTTESAFLLPSESAEDSANVVTGNVCVSSENLLGGRVPAQNGSTQYAPDASPFLPVNEDSCSNSADILRLAMRASAMNYQSTARRCSKTSQSDELVEGSDGNGVAALDPSALTVNIKSGSIESGVVIDSGVAGVALDSGVAGDSISDCVSVVDSMELLTAAASGGEFFTQTVAPSTDTSSIMSQEARKREAAVVKVAAVKRSKSSTSSKSSSKSSISKRRRITPTLISRSVSSPSVGSPLSSTNSPIGSEPSPGFAGVTVTDMEGQMGVSSRIEEENVNSAGDNIVVEETSAQDRARFTRVVSTEKSLQTEVDNEMLGFGDVITGSDNAMAKLGNTKKVSFVSHGTSSERKEQATQRVVVAGKGSMDEMMASVAEEGTNDPFKILSEVASSTEARNEELLQAKKSSSRDSLTAQLNSESTSLGTLLNRISESINVNRGFSGMIPSPAGTADNNHSPPPSSTITESIINASQFSVGLGLTPTTTATPETSSSVLPGQQPKLVYSASQQGRSTGETLPPQRKTGSPQTDWFSNEMICDLSLSSIMPSTRGPESSLLNSSFSRPAQHFDEMTRLDVDLPHVVMISESTADYLSVPKFNAQADKLSEESNGIGLPDSLNQ